MPTEKFQFVVATLTAVLFFVLSILSWKTLSTLKKGEEEYTSASWTFGLSIVGLLVALYMMYISYHGTASVVRSSMREALGRMMAEN